jgi:type II secretory pathway pseudopilin PulG
MKRRLIKHCFNMVEIALALAVLAIGISSILVLFPVGINANRSAIADNNLADISEYLMGYLRAGCAAEWTKIAKDKAAGVTIPDYFFSDKIADGYASVGSGGDAGVDPESSDYTGSSGKVTDNLYQIGSTNSVFLYKQMTGDMVDFAAVVKVWREPYELYIRDGADNTIKKITGGTSAMRQYAMVLCIEISWPALAPYAQREKRLFRQEMFNEAYHY